MQRIINYTREDNNAVKGILWTKRVGEADMQSARAPCAAEYRKSD